MFVAGALAGPPELSADVQAIPVTPGCSSTSPVSACDSGAQATQGRCWQTELIAEDATYTTAYRHVRPTVTFKHTASGSTLQAPAFWDGTSSGKARFRARVAFTKTGEWKWASTCAVATLGETEADSSCSDDANLEFPYSSQKTVTVAAVPAGWNNQIYKRGALTNTIVNFACCYPNYNSGFTTTHLPLRYSDGTPFFWLGDTAWAAPLRATDSEWKTYVDSRAAKGFTVTQMAIAPAWAGALNNHPVSAQRAGPFSGAACLQSAGSPWPFPLAGGTATPSDTSCPTTSQTPNLDFWNRYDWFVQCANDSALVPMISGIASPANGLALQANADVFARWIAARYAGNAVMLSPSFDDAIDDSNKAYFDAVGAALRAGAPRTRLTNHFGQNGSTPDTTQTALSKLHASSWLNFQMFQSGRVGSDLAKITERPRALPQLARGVNVTKPEGSVDFTANAVFANPKKPVVNGEAVYDHGHSVGDPEDTNRFRARQAAYLSYLTGATGTTLGVGGLWEWGVCSGTGTNPVAEPIWCNGTCEPVPGCPCTGSCTDDIPDFKVGFTTPLGAAEKDSSKDMERFSTLFNTPARHYNSLVANEQWRIKGLANSAPQQERPVIARTASSLFVYIPDNATVCLDLAGLGLNSNATAKTPRHNGPKNKTFPKQDPSQSCGYSLYNNSTYLSEATGARDWLLEFKQSSTIQSGLAVPRLDLRPMDRAPEAATGLYADLFDAFGLESREEVLVSGELQSQPTAAASARRLNGQFEVVWIEEDSAAGRSRLFFRSLDSQAEPLSPPIEIETDGTTGPLDVAIGVDALGRALVAWTELDSSGSRLVAAQAVSSLSLPLGPIRYYEPPGSWSAASPQVSCGLTGLCVVAWQERSRGSGESRIRTLSASIASTTLGPPSGLDEPWLGDLWLSKAGRTSFGDNEFEWERIDASGVSRGVVRARLSDDAQVVEPPHLVYSWP